MQLHVFPICNLIFLSSSGENSSFIIDTTNAGKGALSVNLKAAGQDIKHSIRDLGSGRFEVSFVPIAPIPHKVDIKFNNIAIGGGSGRGGQRSSNTEIIVSDSCTDVISEPCELSIGISGA